MDSMMILFECNFALGNNSIKTISVWREFFFVSFEVCTRLLWILIKLLRLKREQQLNTWIKIGFATIQFGKRFCLFRPLSPLNLSYSFTQSFAVLFIDSNAFSHGVSFYYLFFEMNRCSLKCFTPFFSPVHPLDLCVSFRFFLCFRLINLCDCKRVKLNVVPSISNKEQNQVKNFTLLCGTMFCFQFE